MVFFSLLFGEAYAFLYTYCTDMNCDASIAAISRGYQSASILGS